MSQGAAEVFETAIAKELSQSWVKLLAGEVPSEISIFLILWRDRDTKRFVSYGYFLSTSEPPPHMNVEAFVALETREPVRGKRDVEEFKSAVVRGVAALEDEFFRTPKYVRLVVELRDDLKWHADQPRSPIIEVTEREFAEITGIEVKH